MSSLKVYSSSHYIFSVNSSSQSSEVFKKIKSIAVILFILIVILISAQALSILAVIMTNNDKSRLSNNLLKEVDELEAKIATQIVQISSKLSEVDHNYYVPIEGLSFIKIDSEIVYEQNIKAFP